MIICFKNEDFYICLLIKISYLRKTTLSKMIWITFYWIKIVKFSINCWISRANIKCWISRANKKMLVALPSCMVSTYFCRFQLDYLPECRLLSHVVWLCTYFCRVQLDYLPECRLLSHVVWLCTYFCRFQLDYLPECRLLWHVVWLSPCPLVILLGS